MGAQVSWSDLPEELLSLIFQNLYYCADVSRCAEVCFTWKYIIETEYHSPPLILVSKVGGLIKNSKDRIPGPEHQRCFFLNPQTMIFHVISLPELRGRWYSSSSYGWLLTIGCWDKTQNMYLVNPFTRTKVKLPPPGDQIQKLKGLRVITSTSPLNSNCVVAASSEDVIGKLFFCRPGDSTWRTLQEGDYITEDDTVANLHKLSRRRGRIHGLRLCVGKDTIFHKGKLYCMGKCGILYRISFDDDDPNNLHITEAEALPVKKPQFRALEFQPPNYNSHNYLVELDGDLLLVARFAFFGTTTRALEVYKLDWRRKQWVELNNTGNKVIILGKHTSTSFMAEAEEEGGHYFDTNCIYFIDDSMSMSPEINTHDFYIIITEFFEWWPHHSSSSNSPTWFRSSELVKIFPT